MGLNKADLKPSLYLLLARMISVHLIFMSGTILAAALTNKNDISNFFNQEIKDKQQLESFLANSQQEAEQGIESKRAVEALGIKEQELEHKTSELNAVNANSLENKGQEERAKEENAYYERLEVDYNDPKIINHKKDIDKIAEASEKLMSRLTEGLKELGINCKQVKGDRELEPEYAIEIEKEQQKDTVYNQHICEELRSRYNCSDTVTLKCAKKGMQWDPWQYKEVQIPGDTVYHGAKHLGYAIFWKKKRWGWHLSFDSSGWRVFLANHLGIPLEQIGEQIHFPGGARGIGGTHPVYERWRIVFNYYVFGYDYRDGHEVCAQWQEDWHEVCKLQ